MTWLRSSQSRCTCMQADYFQSWVVPELAFARYARRVCSPGAASCEQLLGSFACRYRSIWCACRSSNQAPKYTQRSSELLHPTSDTHAPSEEGAQALPLFGSLQWQAKPTGIAKRQKVKRQDLLCFVGGAVWALDWCPLAGETRSCHTLLSTVLQQVQV